MANFVVQPFEVSCFLERCSGFELQQSHFGGLQQGTQTFQTAVAQRLAIFKLCSYEDFTDGQTYEDCAGSFVRLIKIGIVSIKLIELGILKYYIVTFVQFSKDKKKLTRIIINLLSKISEGFRILQNSKTVSFNSRGNVVFCFCFPTFYCQTL